MIKLTKNFNKKIPSWESILNNFNDSFLNNELIKNNNNNFFVSHNAKNILEVKKVLKKLKLKEAHLYLKYVPKETYHNVIPLGPRAGISMSL